MACDAGGALAAPPVQSGGRPRSGVGRLVAIGALLLAAASPCFAGAEVQGLPDAIQLTMQDASTKEVLEALSAKFPLTYRLSPSASRNLTGRYVGSLRHVLSRLLDGNDYILTTENDRLDVVVLSASGAAPVATVGGPIAGVSPPPPSMVPASRPGPNVPATASVPRPPVVPAASSPPPLATYLPR